MNNTSTTYIYNGIYGLSIIIPLIIILIIIYFIKNYDDHTDNHIDNKTDEIKEMHKYSKSKDKVTK